jgi:glycosyltransferase
MQKVSFILTTYNSNSNLIKTMSSILMQDYPSIEIVIKDGGSSDGTKDLIEKYGKELGSRLIWKSESDKGLYDAMNQGYGMSTGDIVVFFNDVLVHKSVVSHMVNAIEAGGEDCIGAHADLVYANGEKVIRYWHMGKGKIRQGWLPGHPTLYLKRKVYEKYGLFDTSYKGSADYEFMIRVLYGREEKLAYVPEMIVSMFYGGTSTRGIGGYLMSLREGHRGLKKNGVKFAFMIDIKRTVRVLKQFRL